MGHPARLVEETTSRCAAVLLPLDSARIDALTREYVLFRAGRHCRWPVRRQSQSSAHVWCASRAAHARKCRTAWCNEFTRALHEELATFRAAHPALAGCNRPKWHKAVPWCPHEGPALLSRAGLAMSKTRRRPGASRVATAAKWFACFAVMALLTGAAGVAGFSRMNALNESTRVAAETRGHKLTLVEEMRQAARSAWPP